jgi:anti-sigma factor RsiW
MDSCATDKPSHDELSALIDGQLPAALREETLARLAGDPQGSDTLQAWQAQREALRALHRPLLDEAIPESLLAAARRAAPLPRQLDAWWRWGGMAASVLLAFGLGWVTHGQRLEGSASNIAAGGARPASQAFARQAALAHAVYSPEVRHPVEVTAAQQEHLVQWLSKRLGRPLKLPVLASLGYELVGGRLLPGDSGARAQFMFQNAAGLRVTLYLGAVDGPDAAGRPAPGPGNRETAFRYSMDGPVPAFYWVDQGFGYALSGPLPRPELMRLAELVYRQL